MNIFSIEKDRQELLKEINSGLSGRRKLFLLIQYFHTLSVQLNDESTLPFVIEFIPNYLKALKDYNPFGLHPDLTLSVIDSAKEILKKDYFQEYHQQLNSSLLNIKEKYSELIKSLKGEQGIVPPHSRIIFPVLEKIRGKETTESFSCFFESVTITIQKAQGENNFVVVPGERKTDAQLMEQVITSWQLALESSKKFLRKISSYHKVIIKFDGESGTYIGNSLGIILTLGFLRELLLFYNSPSQMNTVGEIAATGSINAEGKIDLISEEIIKKKAEAVFYSGLETFVIPESDKQFAIEELNELHKEFPDRSLKIVGVEQFSDVLNRRDLVEIKKLNPIIRVGNAARKNALALTFAVLLIIVFIFSGLWDFDDNPAEFYYINTTLHIKNKNGKTLLTKGMLESNPSGDKGRMRIYGRIIDINNDGTNEIILANELTGGKNNENLSKITCYNNKGDLVWDYKFEDSVSTPLISHSNTYMSFIIDIKKENETNVLYCFAYNEPLYPSVIFKLDCKTGKRLEGTMWHAGRITDAFLGDFNEDGKDEIIAVAAHNGFEGNTIFSIDTDELFGQAPAPPNYTFTEIEAAKFNTYIWLPLSDIARHFNYRYGVIEEGSVIYFDNSKEFMFHIEQAIINPVHGTFLFVFDNKLNLNKIDCSDAMQGMRDSLVARGILNPPYTNTIEYFKILKDQIRYWDGEKFVKR